MNAHEVEKAILDLLAVEPETSYDIGEVLITNLEAFHDKPFVAKEVRAAVASLRHQKLVEYENNEIWHKPFAAAKAGLGGLQERIEQLEKELAEERAKPKSVDRVVQVQLLKGKKIVKKVTGLFHKDFKYVMDLCETRQNIMLFGPSGCGKSHMLEQLREALGLERSGMCSCTTGMSESIFGGSLLPIGKGGAFEYIPSEFIKCFKNGGIFLIDEMDAADPNTMLFINTALSNGIINLPRCKDEPYIKRHDDFICLASANTPGTNPDRVYNGRNRLDAALLNRFTFKVEMDYDPEIEKVLCPDPELCEIFWGWRKAVHAHRLERIVSTRCLANAYKLKHEKGWGPAEICRFYFSGWTTAELNKLKSSVGGLGF